MGADGVYTNDVGIDREFSQVYGIDDRIGRLMEMIEQSKNDPNISRLTADIIRSCRPHDAKCELTKIFNYTKSHIRYVADTIDVEVFKDPNLSIYDPKHGFDIGLGGDCDDQTLFLASAALISGFPVKLRVTGHNGEYDHIYPLIALNKDQVSNWTAADASVPRELGYDVLEEHQEINVVKEYTL